MFEATLKRLQTGQRDRVCFHIPDALQDAFWKQIRLSKEFNRVRIGKPTKPRTTGELSQNHRIAYLINLITDETGHTYSEIKTRAKYEAISRGYPYRWIQVQNPTTKAMIDQIEPYHEDEIDTVQAGILIDELQRMCTDLDIQWS